MIEGLVAGKLNSTIARRASKNPVDRGGGNRRASMCSSSFAHLDEPRSCVGHFPLELDHRKPALIRANTSLEIGRETILPMRRG
jgi:hypothetical protein